MSTIDHKIIKPIYLQAVVLSAVFIALYFPFIGTMIQDWNINDNYSHGYLIPFISAFMIFTLRRELRQVDISPSNWGLPLILLGLMQLFIAKIGSEYFLQRTSMILVLFGLSLFILGKTFTKKISIPILYLIFMIPIPVIVLNKIAFPMKLYASMLTEWIVQGVGIPILRAGNVLHLAETSLEVADACSGLRSLISMIALSSALVFFSRGSTLKKCMLLLSALPIAIFVNIVRLVLTSYLANRFGEKVAQGFLHEFSGWLIFLLGLAMLFGLYALLTMPSRIYPNDD